VSYDTAQPYLAAFVILRKNGKVAFILRSNTGWMDGYYAVPAGKVELGESVITAAVREASEEAGVKVAITDLNAVHTAYRKSDDDTVAWIDVLFEVKKWKGEPNNAEPHKHGELKWLDPENLPENVIPSIKFYLEQIKDGNTYSEYGW